MLLRLLGHVVEGFGHLADFVIGTVTRACAVLPVGEAQAGIGQPPQGADKQPLDGEEGCEQNRQIERGQPVEQGCDFTLDLPGLLGEGARGLVGSLQHFPGTLRQARQHCGGGVRPGPGVQNGLDIEAIGGPGRIHRGQVRQALGRPLAGLKIELRNMVFQRCQSGIEFGYECFGFTVPGLRQGGGEKGGLDLLAQIAQPAGRIDILLHPRQALLRAVGDKLVYASQQDQQDEECRGLSADAVTARCDKLVVRQGAPPVQEIVLSASLAVAPEILQDLGKCR